MKTAGYWVGLAAATAVGFCVGLIYTKVFETSDSSRSPGGLTAEAPPTDAIHTGAGTPNQANDVEWSSLYSGNFDTYARNLREFRCPEQTIADILIAEVTREMRSKISHDCATADQITTVANFKSHAAIQAHSAALMQLNRCAEPIEAERRNILKRLLGKWATNLALDQSSLIPETQTSQGRDLLGFLPAEKLRSIRSLMQRSKEELRSRFPGGDLTVEQTQEVLRLQKELNAHILEQLNPNEQDLYLMATSGAAQHLRTKTEFFELTDSEFAAVVRLQNDFDSKYFYFGQDETPGQLLERIQAESKLESGIRSILGEQRYPEFESKTQTAYVESRRFTDRNNLPATIADALAETRNGAWNAAKEVVRIEVDGERAAKISTIQESVMLRLKSLLGEELFAKYTQSGLAEWTKQLPYANPGQSTGRRTGAIIINPPPVSPGR